MALSGMKRGGGSGKKAPQSDYEKDAAYHKKDELSGGAGAKVEIPPARKRRKSRLI